jgi:hypothetical protein
MGFGDTDKQADIGLLVANHFNRSLGTSFFQINLDIGMHFRELRQIGCKARKQDRARRCNANIAPSAGFVFRKQVIGSVQQMKDIAGKPQECLAGRCGQYSVRSAFKQWRARVVLKELNSPACRGRSHAKPLSCARDAAQLTSGGEKLQRPKIVAVNGWNP